MILIEVGVDFFKIVINSRQVFFALLASNANLDNSCCENRVFLFAASSFRLALWRSDLLFGLEPFFFGGGRSKIGTRSLKITFEISTLWKDERSVMLGWWQGRIVYLVDRDGEKWVPPSKQERKMCFTSLRVDGRNPAPPSILLYFGVFIWRIFSSFFSQTDVISQLGLFRTQNVCCLLSGVVFSSVYYVYYHGNLRYPPQSYPPKK